MLINLLLWAFRVVQAWFKVVVLYVGIIIKLKYYIQFLTMNQKQSFRPNTCQFFCKASGNPGGGMPRTFMQCEKKHE